MRVIRRLGLTAPIGAVALTWAAAVWAQPAPVVGAANHAPADVPCGAKSDGRFRQPDVGRQIACAVAAVIANATHPSKASPAPPTSTAQPASPGQSRPATPATPKSPQPPKPPGAGNYTPTATTPAAARKGPLPNRAHKPSQAGRTIVRPRPRQAPALEGDTLAQARRVIEARRYAVGATSWSFADAPIGRVFRQSPQAGQAVAIGAPIAVTASLGPWSAPVAAMSGLALACALALMAAIGVRVRLAGAGPTGARIEASLQSWLEPGEAAVVGALAILPPPPADRSPGDG